MENRIKPPGSLHTPHSSAAPTDRATSRVAYLLEAADVGEWELDLTTKSLHRSLKHDRCHGYDDAQAGWTFEDLLRHVHAADRPAVRSAYEATMSGAGDLSCTYRVVWPNAEVHWIEARGRRQIEHDCIVGIVRDVTAFKAVENEVVDVLESMSDGFFAVDKHWIVTRINAQHEKATVFPRAEQIGRSLIDLFFSGPGEKQGKYMQHYRRAMRERVAVQFDDYYEPFDLYTSVRAFPTPDGGLAVFFTDVTEQTKVAQANKAEKHKFEAIFEDSAGCMALLRGHDLIFEKVNASYKQLMGGRELEGKAILEALPELKGQGFVSLLRRVFETGTPFVAYETAAKLVRRPGGEPEDTYFDFTYSRVDDGRGEPYGVYIHAIDITEKVMSRRRTEELAERLQKAVAARDEFLSIASHELKTPVTSLKMQLQMSRRQVDVHENIAPAPAKLAKTLDLCGKQVDRLTVLIDDLLDVSRIESGKLSYEFEITDFATLVLEVIDRFREQLSAAKCTLSTALKADVMVRCDRFRIEQVVANLITNAMKYGAGTPIQVKVARLDEEATLEVTDAGLGIAQDKQSKVFDRFERAITHKNISGLGLGLYIAKEIVDAHGGRICLTSELGHGSTFRVGLPIDTPGVHATQNGDQPAKGDLGGAGRRL